MSFVNLLEGRNYSFVNLLAGTVEHFCQSRGLNFLERHKF